MFFSILSVMFQHLSQWHTLRAELKNTHPEESTYCFCCIHITSLNREIAFYKNTSSRCNLQKLMTKNEDIKLAYLELSQI